MVLRDDVSHFSNDDGLQFNQPKCSLQIRILLKSLTSGYKPYWRNSQRP